MRLLLIVRYLLLMLLCCAGVGMRLHAQPLNKGRIAILGDSIAYAGPWANEVENALKADKKFEACEIVNFAVPSETVAGLSEYGHAGGRFPRPCLHERLDRVLQMYRPQLILACYGMNDGLMQAFDKARFQAYQEGNIRLKKAADAAKAEIVFITPPLFRGIPLNRLSMTLYWTSTRNGWFLKEKTAGRSLISVPGFGSSLPERRPGIPVSDIPVTACTPARKGII